MRGIYALNRGMGLEALLADQPEADHDQRFEELFLAYAMGLIRARPPSEAPRRGGSHDHHGLDRSGHSTQAEQLKALAGPQLARDRGHGTGCSPSRASGCGP